MIAVWFIQESLPEFHARSLRKPVDFWEFPSEIEVPDVLILEHELFPTEEQVQAEFPFHHIQVIDEFPVFIESQIGVTTSVDQVQKASSEVDYLASFGRLDRSFPRLGVVRSEELVRVLFNHLVLNFGEGL